MAMPSDAVTWKQQRWTPCNSTCTVATSSKKLGSFDATVRDLEWTKNGTEAIVMQMASCNAQVASKYVTSQRWWQYVWRKFLMSLIQYVYFTISPVLLLFGVAILAHNPETFQSEFVAPAVWSRICLYICYERCNMRRHKLKTISRWFLVTFLGMV